MGRFIISRDAAGVSFCLQADNGRRLAASRIYATLDACKKGIASLIVNAPAVPLVDSTIGERAPNPKIEIVSVADGVGFVLKSANGKSVITSPRYATKKACLRAISMLRLGVQNASVVLAQSEGLVPVVMTAHMAAVGADAVPAAVQEGEHAASFAVVQPEVVLSVEEITEAACDDSGDVGAEEAVLAKAAEPPAAPIPTEAVPAADEAAVQAASAAAVKDKATLRVPHSPHKQTAAPARKVVKKKTAITAKNLTLAFKKTSQELMDLILKRK